MVMMERSNWLSSLVVGGGATVAAASCWLLWNQYKRRCQWVSEDTKIDRNFLSAVVIALNEENTIGECVEHLHSLDPPLHEIVVCDGGSTDATVSIAKKSGATRVITSARKGRAVQLNTGAGACTSNNAVMFVHADSRPHRKSVLHAYNVLQNPRNILGGWKTKISTEKGVLWWTTFHEYVATWLYPLLLRPCAYMRGLRCLFGDQNMFCRLDQFHGVGGFDESLVIMEDADLCWRMWQAYGGRIVRIGSVWNETSGRRIAAWGQLRTLYIHVRIGFGWWWGMDPEDLYQLYHRLYTDNYR